jgi:putative spermidine/putrescine transport system permease protein
MGSARRRFSEERVMTAAIRRGSAVWTAAMLGLLNIPILVVLMISFSSAEFPQFPPPGYSLRWYQAYFASDSWIDATRTSLQIASLTTLLATPLAVAASVGLVRGRFYGQGVANLLVRAPMVVPGIIAALGFYFFFARLQLVGSKTAIVLAHTALSIPLVMTSVSTAVRAFDLDLERAARSLGADGWQAFWHVTRPSLQPAVLTGALFAFLLSFDELVVALFVGGPNATTLPMRMWTSLLDEVDPTVAAISTLLILLSAVVIVGAGGARTRSESAPSGEPK